MGNARNKLSIGAKVTLAFGAVLLVTTGLGLISMLRLGAVNGAPGARPALQEQGEARSETRFSLFAAVKLAEASIREDWRAQAIAAGIGASFAASFLVLAIMRPARRTAAHDLAKRIAAFAAAEARYRDAAEIASDWFWEIDANRRFTFVSDRFVEVMGIPIDQIIGRQMEELLSVRISADMDMKEIREATAASRPFSNVVLRVELPDRRTRFWRFSGKPTFDPKSGALAAYRGSGSDVSDAVQNEIMLTVALSRAESADQQARRDRERLLQAIEIMPAGFVLWDTDDRLVLCNGHYREIYASVADLMVPGIHYEELMRQSMVRRGESLADPGALRWVKQHLAMRQLTRHSAADPDLRDQRLSDGRWVQVDERPTTDGGVVAVHTDITERRKREAGEREREKLAALGHLAGGVAHEINNLLQPAVIFPELVADRLPASDIESREDLAAILDGARKTREIVKNILRFARKEELALEPLNAVAEIQAALSFVRDVISPAVKIREAPGPVPSACMVAANKTQLAQVITNLVVNGAYAMQNRGTITVAISLWQPTSAEAAQLEIEAGDAYLAIAVSDTGSGMDAAIQARIFEPFFTTKPIGEGTGLGLSVVYGILKSWKGAITVASELGRGTTFTLYIPQLKPEAAPLALTGS